MRDSIRRFVLAALAVAFVATTVAPVIACDGKADSEAQASSSGK